MPDAVRRRLSITGRVQGVFFRESCRRVAEQNGVAGTARNLDDGSVQVVLEGTARAVAEVIAWCRKGPSGASVTGVDVTDEEPEGLSDFRTD
jgi:acylphosphatase